MDFGTLTKKVEIVHELRPIWGSEAIREVGVEDGRVIVEV